MQGTGRNWTNGNGIKATPQSTELAPSPGTDYSDHRHHFVQRRFHMQRQSPVIFWLLLIATICVDVVTFVGMRTELYSALFYTSLASSALILGQLSVACIWSALNCAPIVWKLGVPVCAVVCAAWVNATFSNDPVQFQSTFVSFLAYSAFHAALLIAALWLLQRTAFWRRTMSDSRAWQFSVAHLLIAMTVVAVLAFASRYTPGLSEGVWIYFLIIMPVPVLLAVMSVIIWSLPWNWLLRLAGIVGSALILAACSTLVADLNFAYFTGVVLLVQGLVISAWLAWGRILPVKPTNDALGNHD
jgi:hypothetical protein